MKYNVLKEKNRDSEARMTWLLYEGQCCFMHIDINRLTISQNGQ